MGLDFRKLLIEELERRQQEIDAMLSILRRMQRGESSAFADGFDAARRLELKRKKAPVKSESGGTVHSEIVRLRQQGLSLRAIAGHVHLSHAAVWKALRRHT